MNSCFFYIGLHCSKVIAIIDFIFSLPNIYHSVVLVVFLKVIKMNYSRCDLLCKNIDKIIIKT